MEPIQLAADGKLPTYRGQKICAEIMVKMLEIGWSKEDLPELEKTFWSVRDSIGNVYKPSKHYATFKGNVERIPQLGDE